MADLTALCLNAPTKFVLRISRSWKGKPAQAHAGVNANLFVVAVDPTFDGPPADFMLSREDFDSKLPLAQEGNLLVYEDSTNTLRYATAQEVTDFSALVDDFNKDVSAESAKGQAISPQMRRILAAQMKVTLKLVEQINGIKDAIETGSTMAQIRTAIGNLPTLPNWNLAQLATYFRNQISKDD